LILEEGEGERRKEGRGKEDGKGRRRRKEPLNVSGAVELLAQCLQYSPGTLKKAKKSKIRREI